jgi:glycosyltransferase involved in cell wall biosynthesis
MAIAFNSQMRPRMRITFVLPDASLAGGIRVVAIYAAKLHARGHKVTVISTPRPPKPLKEKLRSVLKGQLISNGALRSHLDNTPADHRVLDRWRPVADRDVPDGDVVIATWWETAEWVARLRASKGAKAYFLQHDETLFASEPKRALATWSLPMHKVAVAKWLVELAGQRGTDAQDISLVPNSVDLEQFRAPPRGKQPAPTVGMMYSWARFKGCDIAIRAFKLAKKKVPDLKLIAFGSPPINDDMPLPPNANYIQQPPQDRIRDIYASADAWIVASRSEGFGLPILEAMACRTPVIATPAGAAPQLLCEGGGMLVKIEDAQDLARAIERVAAMEEESWRVVSDAAYASATRYTWDDATDLFEAALARAASQLFSPA